MYKSDIEWHGKSSKIDRNSIDCVRGKKGVRQDGRSTTLLYNLALETKIRKSEVNIISTTFNHDQQVLELEADHQKT